jgi:hypothetical protein
MSPLAAGRWPLAAGRWPLAAGRWPLAAGRWPLTDDLEGTLCTLGEGATSFAQCKRELTVRNLQRPGIGGSLFGAGETDPEPAVGRVIARGLADEHRDRHYLLVGIVREHVMISISRRSHDTIVAGWYR